MNYLKFFINQFLLPVILAVAITVVYNQYNEFATNKSKDRTNQSFNKTNFFSSVICRGNNHTDRFCKFKNLCYYPVSESFIFFHSVYSIELGIPKERFSPALLDFSSVFDHNTQYFSYIDLPDSSILNFNSSLIKGNFLIFKRFNPENLMHVFHDDLLPAFVTLNEVSDFVDEQGMEKLFFAFADGLPPGPYKELYENFLTNKPLYFSTFSKGDLFCFENAYVGLNKASTWYNYGFKEPQKPILQNMDNIYPIIESFRNYFINKFSIPHSSSNTAVLLTRKLNRKILNDEDIVKEIEHCSSLKTNVVNLENFSIIEAIQMVLQSKLVVGMHGSLLIISLFLSPNSVVVELFPYGVSPNISVPYKTLALILKLVYYSWENTIAENSIPHPEYSPEYGGLLHLSKDEQIAIQTSMVLPFICCSDPVWLYRIYQDTIIDVYSFRNVLRDAWRKHLEIKTKEAKLFPKKFLLPSEVQNISCTNLSENKTLVISWESPWNIFYLQVEVIEYELWIQIVNSEDVKAFLMKRNTFMYPSKSANEEHYIWVRCYADGKKGPFNTAPIVC
ncbi:protein O-linked-mannose beta-1,4-N-acetylglucosaminyltransferase 2-like [Uloborus diversus]|uniref:protein O-linked-mannose beta-1,4-N-acetylglucosaminyltransferase 2-like n=1 Tax=Uloborus diversus TaxID=327109 RepID=UPI00240A351B|nr:protein O-linked-mannose beta-1,4-N-acetylglucosaminyltransferase 2-like [Uloborus diversus]